MSLADVFNTLGQTVMPKVTAAAFPDTMTVKGETTSAGTGGGRVKSAATDVYESVPCSYEATRVENRLTSADKLLSIQQYLVTFPTHDKFRVRYEVDVKKHRLVVNARGTEPAKTFRIIALRDLSGVIFEAVCEREN